MLNYSHSLEMPGARNRPYCWFGPCHFCPRISLGSGSAGSGFSCAQAVEEVLDGFRDDGFEGGAFDFAFDGHGDEAMEGGTEG